MNESYIKLILECVDVFLEEDYEYYQSSGALMVTLDEFDYDGNKLYMVILDEKYPKVISAINQIKVDVKPTMSDVVIDEITTDKMKFNVRLLGMLAGTKDIPSVIKSYFNDIESLLEYYQVLEDNEDTDDIFNGNFTDMGQIREDFNTYVVPEFKSLSIDTSELEQADDSVFATLAMQEVGRMCKLYEAKINVLTEDITSLSDKVAEMESENKLLKDESAANDSALTEKINECDNLYNKVKELESKVTELESAQINTKETLDVEDIDACVEYLNSTSSDYIKSILLKFMQDSNASIESKSPFVLKMFDYIMN